jgi:hypothetical protein
MAKDAFGDILMLGLIGGAAYIAWQWWNAQSVAAVSQPTGPATAPVTTPPVPTPGVYTPPSVTQQMQTAANANSIITAQGGQGDAYQWSTIWNQIGQSPITDINTIFFPSGLPTSAAQVTQAGGTASQQGLPLMPLSTFMAALSSQGISGVGGPNSRLITVPIVLAHQKTSMRIPGNTTPAQLQAMLRSRG